VVSVLEVGEAQAADLRRSALRLVELGAAARWRGPDPYDALFSRWPGPLVGGRRRRQALIQLHARSPVDVRRLYRRRHSLVPKAPALLGQAAVRLWRADGSERPRELAEDAIETLVSETLPGMPAWGYPWDTQTRWSYYPGGGPNIVATTFSACALAEAGDAMDRLDWRRRAEEAAAWVGRELYLPAGGFFAYHGRSERLIHNANLLGAALVHSLAPLEPTTATAVRTATSRTLDAQRPDGTWPYGDGEGLDWVDSFHTGYVLASLRRLRDVDPRVSPALERGARAYADFFDPKGRPRLWRDSAYPEDSHSAGTGLTVLTPLAREGLVPRSIVANLARYTSERLLHRDGRAVFRRGRLGATSVRYLRWCDAQVALGFATAASLGDEA